MTMAVWLDADEGIHSVGDALVHGWSFPVVPFIGLALTLAIYLRGWWAARKTRAEELPAWRAAVFTAGIGSMWMALASPIDALDDVLLSAHMLQHFILMSVAPPLIMLGAPVVPMLRGLPRVLVRGVVGPLMRVRWLQAVMRFALHPAVVWLAMNIAYLGWHVPAMFELTFTSERIHNFEHLIFFVTNLAFWWVVFAPWPAEPRWPRWAMIPYLLSADILNTVLSAALVFSGRVLYPSYEAAERVTRMTALEDQAAAGAFMWVANSTVFLIPAVVMTAQLLMPKTGIRGQRSGVSYPRSPEPGDLGHPRIQ
jgi:putative membrane protein